MIIVQLIYILETYMDKKVYVSGQHKSGGSKLIEADRSGWKQMEPQFLGKKSDEIPNC